MKNKLCFVVVAFLMALTAHSNPAVKKNAVPPVEQPKKKIVTTLAVIAAIAKEIGGDFVKVDSLTESAEDPHFVKAKPTFKRLVSEADLFFQIGRSLELWVPQVISSSGNQKLMGSGVISVSDGFKSLEVPKVLTRKEGDIHPLGNPHIWLSPLGGLKIAENIKKALIAADAAHKDVYEKNFVAFKDKLAKALFGEELVKSSGDAYLFRLYEAKTLKDNLAKRKKPLGGWLKQAESIDYPFITYHRAWSYLIDELGLKFFDAIEEKSGVAPTIKYKDDLVARAKANNVKHIFDARYYIGNSKLIELIAQEIGGQKLFIDADCLPGETFVAMMDRIIKALVDFKNLPNAAPKKP